MRQNPWDTKPDHTSAGGLPEAPRRRVRNPYEQPKIIRLVIFLTGMAMMLFGLSLAFPLTSSFDPYLIRSLIILLIFGSAAAFWSRASLMKIAKVSGIWILIITGISIFYLYRSDLGERFMTSIDPAAVINTNEGLIIHRSNDGHFWAKVRVNGVLLRMMVDTGASNIVLSPDDAERAGFPDNLLRFSEYAETANGKVAFARATATTVTFGETNFYDIPLTVNSAPMSGSLLGMSVLKKFSSIEFKGNTLILRE